MSSSAVGEKSSEPELVPLGDAAWSRLQPWPPARPSSVERLVVLLPPHATPVEAAAQLWHDATAYGFGEPAAWSLEQAPVPRVSAADTAAVAAFGGALLHVGTVVRGGSRPLAWTGPTFAPRGHLLAGVPDGHAAVVARLTDGREVLSAVRRPWPVDGDSAFRVLSLDVPFRCARRTSSPAVDSVTPSPWLVRLTFAHVVPPPSFIARLLADAGLPVDHVLAPADCSAASSRWVRLEAAPRTVISRAAAGLHAVHRVELQAWSVLPP